MHPARKSHPVAMFSAWFLTVFIVMLPKGGVKFGGVVPITWGYIYLAITAPPLIVVRLLATSLRIKKTVLAAIFFLVPFQILTIYMLVFYGLVSATYAISTFTNLFFMPWMFLLVYPPFLKFIDGERLAGYMRWSILLAAIWGIFNFFWHPFMGHYIEIPYLTVNAADYGNLEYTKHIARGFFFKLISTYNNGNLYGVCMLLLLPLYNLYEKKTWRRWVLKVALLLTLSRTVWVGMVLEQFLTVAVLLSKQVQHFPRLYLGKASKQVAALAVTVGFIFTGLVFNSASLAFLFDPTAGGRSAKLGGLFNTTFLPNQGVSGFDEILYVSAAAYWGYAGLIAFVLMMFSPIFLLFIDSSPLESPSRRAALKGLVLYILMAAMDGGYNFIPTQAFYWFVFMIYIFGWPPIQEKIKTLRPAVARAPQGAGVELGEAQGVVGLV